MDTVEPADESSGQGVGGGGQSIEVDGPPEVAIGQGSGHTAVVADEPLDPVGGTLHTTGGGTHAAGGVGAPVSAGASGPWAGSGVGTARLTHGGGGHGTAVVGTVV